MTDFNLAGGSGIAAKEVNKHFLIQQDIDLNAMPVKPISTDVINALNIPANTLVLQVRTVVLVQSVATALTATVGDGDAADGWDAAIDFEGAVGDETVSRHGTDAHAATGDGKRYAAADTIDLVMTVNTVTTWGKIRVIALCVDLS